MQPAIHGRPRRNRHGASESILPTENARQTSISPMCVSHGPARLRMRADLWFWRKWWRLPCTGACTSVSRRRIKFVALCVGLVTGADEHASRFDCRRSPAAAARAASFLKHKLWRISNTTPRTSCLALCRAAQVVDRSVICVLGFALARLLLVDT